MASALDASDALDLFTGTTRVAQEFRRRGIRVTAVDNARYAAQFARCYIEIDPERLDRPGIQRRLSELASLHGIEGYVTDTFCRKARYFQPHNGQRIDAIRAALDPADPLFPVLLVALIEAADRVDSTTGLQMAYLKTWAPRAFRPLELRAPEIPLGPPGTAILADALELVRTGTLPPVDLAYLDPPYNQHRYTANYHVWETLAAGDEPESYGVAQKRTELRDPSTRSVFNSRRLLKPALEEAIAKLEAATIIVSYNDESWLSLDELIELCAVRGHVEVLACEQNRYVGARIGIHNPRGERVGTVKRLRNREYVAVAGERSLVARASDAALAYGATRVGA